MLSLNIDYSCGKKLEIVYTHLFVYFYLFFILHNRKKSKMEYNGIRPKSREEARIWNKYNGGEWDWIPIRYWPSDIAKAVISKNLNYTTRFRWYLYLVGNGMDPDIAHNVVKDQLIANGSSGNNLDHIDQLNKDLEKNENKWSYWDEHLRKTMKIGDTIVGRNHTIVIRRRIKSKPFTGINTTNEWLKKTFKKNKKWDDGTYDSDDDSDDY